LRWARALGTAVVALLLWSGCGSGDGRTTASAAPPPAGCSKSEVEARVQAFAAALREPDLAQLRAIWAEPRFKWFSVFRRESGRTKWKFAAFKKAKALRWVEQQGGVPIRITEVRGGTSAPKAQGHSGFSYEGRWHGHRFQGKGDMLCQTPEIRVWSAAIAKPPS